MRLQIETITEIFYILITAIKTNLEFFFIILFWFFDAYLPDYAAILVDTFLTFFGKNWGKIVGTIDINSARSTQ